MVGKSTKASKIGLIKSVNWPSASEVSKVSWLVVATIVIFAAPLYIIDASSSFIFEVLRKTMWSILGLFS